MANTGSDKDWLQRLKNESWEAELLVSAIAIFGTACSGPFRSPISVQSDH